MISGGLLKQVDLMKLKDVLIRFVYPRRCVLCSELIGIESDKYLCSDCEKATEYISGNVCEKCGMPIDYPGMCRHCRNTKRHFDEAFAVYRYEGRIREAIHRFKYRGKGGYAKFFGTEMAHFADLEEVPYVDYVVPVPISDERRRRRGYNQCELLADVYCRERRQVCINALVRIKKTKPQNELKRKERVKNVKNAFALSNDTVDLKDSSVLIIDDIFTTGSTADECAKVLKRAGAAEVYVLCLSISVK